MYMQRKCTGFRILWRIMRCFSNEMNTVLHPGKVTNCKKIEEVLTKQAIESKEEGDMMLQCTSAQEESKTFTHYAGKRNLGMSLKSEVILCD